MGNTGQEASVLRVGVYVKLKQGVLAVIYFQLFLLFLRNISTLLLDQYDVVADLWYFRLIVSNGRRVLLPLILIVIKAISGL